MAIGPQQDELLEPDDEPLEPDAEPDIELPEPDEPPLVDEPDEPLEPEDEPPEPEAEPPLDGPVELPPDEPADEPAEPPEPEAEPRDDELDEEKPVDMMFLRGENCLLLDQGSFAAVHCKPFGKLGKDELWLELRVVAISVYVCILFSMANFKGSE